MIVLNTAKELIKVESWTDILDRPGFSTDLDPAAHTLDAIIGRYAFADRVRCGLSNCHTPHAKGYIVVTKDGRETNIGKDCGKTYFGVDFETLSNKFDRDITEKENRDKLWSFSFRLDDLKKQVSDLRTQERGANWVHSCLRKMLEPGKGVPSKVVRTLATMVKTRQPVVSLEREATEQEIENMEAIQNRRLPRPQYVAEPIAELSGFEAVYPENDLRALLVVDLDEGMKGFEQANIDSLGFEELRKWAKWIGTVDATMDRAIGALDSGRKLLVPANLEPLGRLVTDAEGTSLFRKFLKSLKSPTR